MRRLVAASMACLMLGGCTLHSRSAIDYDILGTYAAHAGDFEQAASYFNASIDLESESPAGYVGLCQAYAGLGRFEDALQECNRAIQNSGGAYSYGVRASIHAVLGNYEESRDDYGAAQDLNPHYVHYDLLSGIAHNRLGEYAEAITDLNRVIGHSRRTRFGEGYEARAFYLRSIAYQNLGEQEWAARDRGEALRIEPALQRWDALDPVEACIGCYWLRDIGWIRPVYPSPHWS